MDADSPFLVVLALLGGLATTITLLWVIWIIAGALFRRPKLRLEFRKLQGSNGWPLIVCELYNDPLHGFPFNALNIRRDSFDELFVYPAHLITEDGANTEIDAALHDRHGQGHGDSHSLPASIHPLLWPVVCYDDIGPSVVNAKGIQTYILPGTHELVFLLHADDVDVGIVKHTFLAGADSTVFEWVGQPSRIEKTLIRRLGRSVLNVLLSNRAS